MTDCNQYRFNPGEWLLLHSVLNEVINGLPIEDYESVIGLEKADLEKFLGYLHELPRDAELRIDERRLVVFRNALHETLRMTDDWEFKIRTAYSSEEARKFLKQLDDLIHPNHHWQP